VKRDMDLCRDILRLVEASPDSAGPAIKIDGRSDEEMSYHIKLLGEAGLLEVGSADGRFIKDDGRRIRLQKAYSVISLTWQGHEFLDAARNDTV
jgi:DNA-binding transcriptional ArsR family regulator